MNKHNKIQFIEYNIAKIETIIIKLSIGHAVYSLSAIRLQEPLHINFKFLPDLTQEEIIAFNTCPEKDISPEVGSREGKYIHISSEGRLLYDWKIVQENQYRFLAFVSKNTICIRIVIGEFFFSEVIWNT